MILRTATTMWILRVRGHRQRRALVRDPSVHSSDVSISRLTRAFGLADGSVPQLPALRTDALSALPADTIKRKWPLVLPETPLVDRYDPLTDLNAVEWRKAHPTFDGRGTGIAIIDQTSTPTPGFRSHHDRRQSKRKSSV